MSDPTKKSKEADDRFAQLLEEKHEQLIAGENTDDVVDAQTEEEDERVRSAAMILQLLEQVNPARPDRPPEQLAIETRDDPSTRKTDALLRDQLSTPSIEHVVPDLKRLGRFEIQEQIGRGGFGIVVRARDPKLERNVAIKIPRFEAALSPQSRQRFEREAKAAASLNHPGIVSVYETGNEQGIDFIVTELIDGENLATHLARGNTFSPKESAKLVARIADALEHAHQRNVLHRDMKPSNILLSSDPSGPKPLIADFGLAAMSDQHDFTQTGAVVGTPAYMSPEQATGNKNLIGSATDVYGLGTILYQLLTGKSPFAELPVIEMLDAINRRDPESPRAINPAIPKDIESICLKCLEKKPDRRYPTTQELQADLQRFINGSPVVARRITSLDRSLRWVRRNPVLATVGSSSLVFLLIALFASIWGWNSTTSALRRESLAKNDARQTVNRYFTDVAENELLDVPGLLPLRQELLNNALSYYQRYLLESSNETMVVEELELAHFRIGKIQSELGDYAKAIESFETANSLQDQALAESDNDPKWQARKLDAMRHLGQAQDHLGNDDQALQMLETAIQGQRQLIESDPGELDWRYQLSRSLSAKATILADQGDFVTSIDVGDELVELLSNLSEGESGNVTYRRNLAEAYAGQANAVAKTGDVDQSVKSIDNAIQIFRQLVESESPTPKDIHALASALYNRAGKHLMKRQADLALPLLEEAGDLNRFLVLMFPNAVEYRRQKLAFMNGLGFCYSRLQLTDKVVEVLSLSIETLKVLKIETPGNSKLTYELAVAQMNLGETLADQTDELIDARNLLKEAELNFEAFLAKTPGFFQGKMASAFCQKNLAALCNKLEDYQLALNHADRSIEALEAINAEKPDVPQVVQSMGGAYLNRAEALEFLHREDESISDWRVAANSVGPDKVRSELRLAEALARTGDASESKKILDNLVKDPSTKARFGGSLGRAQAAIAKAWSESERVEPAQVEAMLDQAVESIRTWFEQPKNQSGSIVKKIRTLEAYDLLLQRDDFQRLLDDVLQTIESGKKQ